MALSKPIYFCIVTKTSLNNLKCLLQVVNRILDSGKRLSVDMKSESPLLWEWHDKIYFGAAHGMAGILYMLLQVRYSMAY